MHNLNRRRFLRLGARTLCGAGLALGSNPWQTLARAADGEFNQHQDYRALVCVYLEGGIDGFSLLVPTGSAEYSEYANSRQDLTIDRTSLHDLQNSNSAIGSCGLNPHAGAIKPLYDNGQLAFVSNVGTLIEPTTKEQYENQAVRLPTQLFSHSDQEIQWQQLQGQTTSTEGWGALAAQQLSAHQQKDYLTSVTLSGSNYWQSGGGQRPFSMKSSGLVEYAGMSDGSEWQRPRVESFHRINEKNYSNVYMDAYADLQQRAASITTELGQVLDSQAPMSTPVPVENQLAEDLAMVARLISTHEMLGMKRQIFYVSMDGFDVHDAQNKELPWLFSQLGDALSWFQATLYDMGMSEKVTTFTASDFGRSLTSNGDGTDHGWGNHHMVMGGAVNGADIYGAMPRMSVDGPDAVRNGRVVPTLAASQYAATMLRWAGLEDAGLDEALPDLGNFAQRDLGFLRS